MEFKNTETGVVWDITNDTHIKRCESDPNYEKVEEKKVTPKKTNTGATKTTQRKKATSAEK
ncbi:hypothetical protein [Radiobacillus sp. PE A8.2]|uniref:hypothetical protein n=1 Tax=Radiobacillus sp. PE A8.2 TaxID=3380349 RepID=UPI00388D186A